MMLILFLVVDIFKASFEKVIQTTINDVDIKIMQNKAVFSIGACTMEYPIDFQTFAIAVRLSGNLEELSAELRKLVELGKCVAPNEVRMEGKRLGNEALIVFTEAKFSANADQRDEESLKCLGSMEATYTYKKESPNKETNPRIFEPRNFLWKRKGESRSLQVEGGQSKFTDESKLNKGQVAFKFCKVLLFRAKKLDEKFQSWHSKLDNPGWLAKLGFTSPHRDSFDAVGNSHAPRAKKGGDQNVPLSPAFGDVI
jgi:hypothetical protein